MKGKRNVKVAVVGEMVGGLWQGDVTWTMESSGGLYALPWEVQLQGTLGCKDSCYLSKWECNGAGFLREKLWEVRRAQDRLEDQVWGRTKQDSERLGSRNQSKGFMAIGGWLIYWLVYHQLFRLPLQYYFVQTQSPGGKSTGWALATGMLPGYFERQALVSWTSILRGGHLELPSFIKPNGMLVNPQKETRAWLGWRKWI